MNVYVIMAVIVGLPLLLTVLFRVNAILFFVSVAAGALLVQYFSDDASIVADSFFTHANADVYVRLGLLLVPVILSILFLRKSLSAPQLVFHLIPLIVTSAALGTLIISLLPGGVHHDIVSNPIGKIVDSSENVAVAASAILTLLLTWFTMGHSGGKKDKRGKH